MTSADIIRNSDEQKSRKYFRSPTQISAEMRFCHQLARRGVPLVRIHQQAMAEGFDISYGTVVNRIKQAERVYQSLDIDDVLTIRRMIKSQLEEINLERLQLVREARDARQFKAAMDGLAGADASLLIQAKLAPGVMPETNVKHTVEQVAKEEPDDELDELLRESSEAEERVRLEMRSGL